VLLRSLFAADEKVPATHLIAVIGEGNDRQAEIEAFIKVLLNQDRRPPRQLRHRPRARCCPCTASQFQRN